MSSSSDEDTTSTVEVQVLLDEFFIFRIHPVFIKSMLPVVLFFWTEFFNNKVGWRMNLFFRLGAAACFPTDIEEADFLLEDPRQYPACFWSCSWENIFMHNGHSLTLLHLRFRFWTSSFRIVPFAGRLLFSQSLLILSCVT